MLDHEEYVEQEHFFRSLRERLGANTPAQDLLALLREEALSTTNLPMAIDFLSSELKLKGVLSPGMALLHHYFTPFQTFVVAEAENERGKFDLSVALLILEREAKYRAEGALPQGIFLYEFESLCRNRLGYDRGLQAIAGDDVFDEPWREWIMTVRRQVGLIDIADMIYVRSTYYQMQQARMGHAAGDLKPILFGEKEGRIALANRHKDPLLLFASMHRQLGYPEVPRLTPFDESPRLAANLMRRVDRLEARLKLMEEEQRGGIDITRFYRPAFKAEPDQSDEEPTG